MAADATLVGDLLTQLVREGRRRILLLTSVFAVVALIGLLITMVRPKKYECNATLLVTSSSVLSSSPSAPKGADPALITQIVYGRPVLRELLAAGGWTDLDDPRVEERRLNELRGRIRITQSRPELIRLAYTDTDPKRAFAVATKLVQIYIREAAAPAERETRKVLAVLDKQVQEYSERLADAHAEVLAHYRSSESADAATEIAPDDDPAPQPDRQPPRRRQGGGISPAELAALRAEENTLATELKRQEDALRQRPTAGRDELRYRERAQQLQAELDRLLTTYTEDHPDVKRTRRELERIKAAEEQAQRDREEAEATAFALDRRMMEATRARLAEVQKRIDAAERGGRRPEADRPEPGRPVAVTTPGPEDPELRIIRRDSTMTELLRQYETTRDIYQDLLKRRENARIALQLAEGSGLGLKVQEAPEMPVTSVSTRLLYLVAAAMFVAGLAPLALLFALVRLDPRLRGVRELQQRGEVPFLVNIPFVPQQRDRSRGRRRALLAVLMILGVFAAYLSFFIIRLKASS